MFRKNGKDVFLGGFWAKFYLLNFWKTGSTTLASSSYMKFKPVKRLVFWGIHPDPSKTGTVLLQFYSDLASSGPDLKRSGEHRLMIPRCSALMTFSPARRGMPSGRRTFAVFVSFSIFRKPYLSRSGPDLAWPGAFTATGGRSDQIWVKTGVSTRTDSNLELRVDASWKRVYSSIQICEGEQLPWRPDSRHGLTRTRSGIGE